MLSDSSETAHHAPISSGKFRDDIRFLGATPVVKEMLEVTHVYPPGMDTHTHLLFEETARLFSGYNSNLCHYERLPGLVANSK